VWPLNDERRESHYLGTQEPAETRAALAILLLGEQTAAPRRDQGRDRAGRTGLRYLVATLMPREMIETN
jgi:hypothetical protein